MRNLLVPVVDGRVDMTSGFRTPVRPTHNGVDFFSVPRGTKLPVLSFDSGSVVLVQYGHRRSGHWMEILQDDGLTLTYKHFDSVDAVIGQRVARGQRIGIMGKSGDATGVHLHLEARRERQNVGGRNAFDPMPMILARMKETEKEASSMNIIQRPSPNRTAGRQGHAPDVIVFHITDGNFPGSIDWVVNPASQVSYHFMVSRSGEITQCVDMADTAWANGTTMTAGDSRNSQNSTLAIVRERRVNANLYTVSVGFEGVSAETNGRLTLAQQDACVRLVQHIRGEARRLFGADIPVARTHIVGHSEVTPLTRPNCPGRDFPFDEIIRALGGIVPVSSPSLAPSMPPLTPSTPSLTPPTQSVGRNFRVLVGEFATREEAEAARDEVRKIPGRGDAFLVLDGYAWQVQAASGPNLDGAERIARELLAAGIKGVLVV